MARKISDSDLKPVGLLEKYDVKKVALAVRIFFEAYRVVQSAVTDYENKTTRNSLGNVVSVGSSFAGSFAGAAVGRRMGTAIKNDRGSRVGGVVGAVLGGILASRVGSAIFNKISDACNYNLEEVPCSMCKKLFKRPKYKKNQKAYCEACKN